MSPLYVELEGDTLRFASSLLMDIQVVRENPEKSGYQFFTQEPAMFGEYHKPCSGLILTPLGAPWYINLHWYENGQVSVHANEQHVGMVSVGENIHTEVTGREVKQ